MVPRKIITNIKFSAMNFYVMCFKGLEFKLVVIVSSTPILQYKNEY